MAITKDQIIEAAEALLEQGKAPTLAAVRAELGGGSFTTISEVMKVWKAQQAKAKAQSEVIQVPASVQEAMGKAAITVWTAATQHHAAQLAAEREALEEERSRLEAERQEAVELADQVSRDLEAAEARAEKAETELEAKIQALSVSRAMAAEADATAAERGVLIDKQVADLGALRAEALSSAGRESRLAADLETAQGQADASAAKLVEVEQRVAAETLRADRAEGSAKQAEVHAADLGGEIKALREEAKAIGGELAQSIADAKVGKRELDKALAQVQNAEGRERQVRDEAAELRGKLAALEAAAPAPAKKSTSRRRTTKTTATKEATQ